MTVIPAANAPSDLVGYSIVLVGPVDPLSAQPSNLFKKGLISEEDFNDLTYDLLLKDVVSCKLPWMQLTIEPEKLSIQSTLTSPAPEPIRDFVLDFLDQMPMKRFNALGINRDTHIALPSTQALDDLLERLADVFLRPARDLKINKLDDEATVLGLINPVIRALVLQADRRDDTHGMVVVRTEPSARLVPGVYLQVNDHFDLAPGTSADENPDWFLKPLTDGWDETIRRVDNVVAAVREQINALA